MSETHLIDSEDVLKEDLHRDAAFRRFWERTAPARAVANSLIAYRIEHELTQEDMAHRIGIRPQQVEKMESGEYNPTWFILERLASRIGLMFWYGVAPTGAEGSQGLTTWKSLLARTLITDASVEDVTTPTTRVVAGAKVLDDAMTES